MNAKVCLLVFSLLVVCNMADAMPFEQTSSVQRTETVVQQSGLGGTMTKKTVSETNYSPTGQRSTVYQQSGQQTGYGMGGK